MAWSGDVAPITGALTTFWRVYAKRLCVHVRGRRSNELDALKGTWCSFECVCVYVCLSKGRLFQLSVAAQRYAQHTGTGDAISQCEGCTIIQFALVYLGLSASIALSHPSKFVSLQDILWSAPVSYKFVPKIDILLLIGRPSVSQTSPDHNIANLLVCSFVHFLPAFECFFQLTFLFASSVLAAVIHRIHRLPLLYTSSVVSPFCLLLNGTFLSWVDWIPAVTIQLKSKIKCQQNVERNSCYYLRRYTAHTYILTTRQAISTLDWRKK